MDVIYEIVDTTSEEVYYPCGLFSDLDVAKSIIENFKTDDAMSSEAEEFEVFEIRERTLNKLTCSHFVITRAKYIRTCVNYNDAGSDPQWRITSTEFFD